MDLIPLLLMFGLLGVMMYFMTRRQRRAQEQQAKLQNSLDVGDRVMTTSGLYGTITDSDDATTVTLEIAPGVETEWLRAAVREKVGPVEELDEDIEDDDLVAADDVPATVVDAETNEPVVKKDDAELGSGKQK
ncbi:preprotein translocase subunit YajC [Actinophytocola oryzae]|uniref:Protein translocase subunit yajC n=1 Tax=Actinophytocola oryzae TaxID=502181 RepID=A0A4R7VIA0_9PSEU|nr:preprotein translocase subunit YajC [Actinophytocola oryzae]TDV48915.1 protein translocase subunit yajC [Actinophytocola oryzae]